MTHRTILLHRGGFGPQYRLGSIEVRPEGTDFHGFERFAVRLDILGDRGRSSCSCVAEALEGVIADFTATARIKMTYVEAGVSRRNIAEQDAARRRRARQSRRRYAR